ncbi:MAG: choice-of-anchor J domain-containing protein [Bacteroidetes bacterium]|nr:choice-of-anchor J domain-containing protein [Bacteroidota bacterium]
MKKLLLLSALTGVLCSDVVAQPFTETFNSGIPATWLMIKNDNNVPSSSFNATIVSKLTTQAWMAWPRAAGDSCALTTSWFTSPGTADRWLITPSFQVTDTNMVLSWEDYAADSTVADSLQVLLSPTAGTTAAAFTTTLYNSTGSFGGFMKKGIALRSYLGQTIRIAFRDNSYDKYILMVDNVGAVVAPAAKDMAVVALPLIKYSNGANFTIKARVQSLGAQNVTSFRLNYKIGSGPTVTQTFTNPLSYQGTATIAFTTQASVTTSSNISVWVDQVNGSADQNPANDMMQKMVYYIANQPPKNVLLEEFTGAWCQYCPDGLTVMKQVFANVPGSIGTAIHNQDAMVNTDAQVIDQTYSVGYPSGLIDRYLYDGQATVATNRGDWQTLAAQRRGHPVPAKVSFVSKTYNAATRQLSVTIKADFVATVAGDYRLGLIITEDNVYNSSNVTGWSQVNAYNTQSGSEWYQLGNPMIGFKHQHVVEAMLGGSWGDAGIIPTNVSSGQSFTKTYTYTIPATLSGPIYRWNENNMHIVAYVSEYDANPTARPILNSAETHLLWPLSVNNISSGINATKVYPNPAKDQATLSIMLAEQSKVTVYVYDAIGKMVFEKPAVSLPSGENNININTNSLATGMYTIKILTEKGAATETLSVIK